MPLPKIEIKSHKIRGQRGCTYSAEGTHNGVKYDVCGASSRKDARDQARADIAFCAAQPSCEAHGFKLTPESANSFDLRFPTGRGSYGFSASSTALALARLALEYHDHPDVPAFVRAAVDALDAQNMYTGS